MKINYEEFLSRFESSGKSQSAFGLQEGISPSMVSYYVRKGRELKDSGTGFASLKISSPSSSRSQIKIRLPNGIELDIPI